MIMTDLMKPGRSNGDRPSPLRSMGSSNSEGKTVSGTSPSGRQPHPLGLKDDLAFGLACRASDESDRPASNVTDASQKTFWRTAQSREEGVQAELRSIIGAWIELDLSHNDFERRPVQVTQIIIFWYGNCHSDNFKIQTSIGQSWHTAIEGSEAKHCSAAEGYKFHSDIDGDGKRWTGSTFNRISKLPRLDGLCSKIRLEMGDGHPDIWFGRYKFGIRRLVIRGFYRKDPKELNLSLDSFLAKQRKSGLSLRHSFHDGEEDHHIGTPEDADEPAWLLSSRRKRRSGGGKRVHPPAMIRSNGFPTVSMFMNKAADVGSNKAWLATGSPLLKIANRRRIDEAKQGIRPCSTQADKRLREEVASREAGIDPNSGAAKRESSTDENGGHSRTATASTQEGPKSDVRGTSADRQIRPGRRTFLPMLPATLYDNFVCRVGSRSYTPPHHRRRLTAHEEWFYENGHLGGRRKSLEGIRQRGTTTQTMSQGKARLGAESRFWPSEEEKRIIRSKTLNYPPPVRRRGGSRHAGDGPIPKAPPRDDDGNGEGSETISLMSGWEEVRTADGEVYYANCETGESVWDKPTRLEVGWTEHFSPDGEKYYFNEQTGLSTWTRPSRTSYTRRRSSQSEVPNLSADQADQLRETLSSALGGEDWTTWRRVKAENDRVYFFNIKTKATAWEFPAAVLAKAPECPSGWKKVATDSGDKKHYYWNEETDEVSWEYPLPFYDENLDASEESSVVARHD